MAESEPLELPDLPSTGERMPSDADRPRRTADSPCEDLADHIARTHRSFLRRQAELQRAFLEMRCRGSHERPRRGPTDDGPSREAIDSRRDFGGRIDEPAVSCVLDEFDRARLEAFADGDIYDAFGPGYERAACQTAPPDTRADLPAWLRRIDAFEPTDGPHGGGYVRGLGDSESRRLPRPDELADAALLLGGFYLAGCGRTLNRDGWNYEFPCAPSPVGRTPREFLDPDAPLCVELLVLEHVEAPRPSVDALFRVTVGDTEISSSRLEMRLVPSWPLLEHPDWKANSGSQRAATVDGLRLDEDALLAGALGPLRRGLGPEFAQFDGPGRTARLPGPPYQFMTRVLDLDAGPGELEAGAGLVAEYDVPECCWYFHESGSAEMPLAVLLEVGLQPCGWLAVYGLLPEFDDERFFRNLDGSATIHRHVSPETERLRTEVALTSVSRTGGMVLVGYESRIFAEGTPVCTIETDFGFFSERALLRQKGLPESGDAEQRTEPRRSPSVEFDARPADLFDGTARLPGPMLCMLDEWTGWWPDAGEAGLGRLRARSNVEPDSWYFRAHFFQDPVQPGSLGVEAMLQLLQCYMLYRDLDERWDRPCFDPVESGRTVDWRYRGQVLPEHDEMTVEIEVVELDEFDDGTVATADGSLWVDGRRIYQVEGLALRLGPADSDRPETVSVETLDPETDEWLDDHRPTYTRPAVPLTVVADRIASAAASHSDAPVAEIRELELADWLVVDQLTTLSIEVGPESDSDWCTVAMYARDARPTPGSERPRLAATARVRCSESRPAPAEPFDPLAEKRPIDAPYEDSSIFHGPAFQLLKRGAIGSSGARGVADARPRSLPVGELHPALLDAALHLIPHESLDRWSERADRDRIAFPHRLDRMHLFAPPPREGEVALDVRFRGFERGARLPIFDVRLASGGEPWAEFRIVGRTVPKGPFGRATPDERRRFLDDRRFVPDLRLARVDGGETRVSAADLKTYSWFEGLVEDVYDVDGDLAARLQAVAVKEHLAHRLRVHPSRIRLLSHRSGRVTAAAEGSPRTHELLVRRAGPLEYAALDRPSNASTV